MKDTLSKWLNSTWKKKSSYLFHNYFFSIPRSHWNKYFWENHIAHFKFKYLKVQIRKETFNVKKNKADFSVLCGCIQLSWGYREREISLGFKVTLTFILMDPQDFKRFCHISSKNYVFPRILTWIRPTLSYNNRTSYSHLYNALSVADICNIENFSQSQNTQWLNNILFIIIQLDDSVLACSYNLWLYKKVLLVKL